MMSVASIPVMSLSSGKEKPYIAWNASSVGIRSSPVVVDKIDIESAARCFIQALETTSSPSPDHRRPHWGSFQVASASYNIHSRPSWPVRTMRQVSPRYGWTSSMAQTTARPSRRLSFVRRFCVSWRPWSITNGCAMSIGLFKTTKTPMCRLQASI